jgi:hypothetical protein
MMRNKCLQHRFVETMPELIEPGILYVSMEYATASHRCCCGCGAEVVTPFSPAQWQMTFDGDAVSLHPSIGNWNLRCRSHYFVREGRVVEALTWTEKEIEAGRRRDKDARTTYLTGNGGPAPSPKSSTMPKQAGWLRRLIERVKLTLV